MNKDHIDRICYPEYYLKMDGCKTFQLILFLFSFSLLPSTSTAEVHAAEGSIRLAGGNFESEGRVELYHTSSWGTVCDGYWDISDADVVCRQLGYSGALSAEYGGTFDVGTGDILFNYVECSGYEDRLIDCLHGDWFQTVCSHYNDAGVRCIEPEYLTPRLVNGSSPNEGRVEVWIGYQWERVCQSWFNSFAEDVVCRQLGYDAVSTEEDEYSRFGKGDAMPVALQFICNDPGDETESLSGCDLNTIERFDCDGVSIKCYYYEGDEDRIPARLRVYLILGGVVVLISIVSGSRYSKMKKRKQTQPNDTPATQATPGNTHCQNHRTTEVTDTTVPTPLTNEGRPPHHLPPMDRPPSYSEVTLAPPSYEMGQQMVGQHPVVSSYLRQQTLSVRENAYEPMGSIKGDNIDNLTNPSRYRLYENSGSTQLPAPPVLVRPEDLPSVT